MRFMSLYKPGHETCSMPSEQQMKELMQLVERLMASGVMIATDGLHPSANGARVRVSNGSITVTDGPFAETKEVIGGYAIFEVSSKAEAIELARQFLSVMGEGECEVRQMHDAAHGGHCAEQMPRQEAAA